MMTRVSQLWDLIETWGFHEDIKDIVANDNNNNNDDDDDNNDKDKGIAALGLDGGMGYSQKIPKWALKKYFTDRSRIMNHTFL